MTLIRHFLLAKFLIFSSASFAQTVICTKVFNPNQHLRDLSIGLDLETSRKLMIYAMAGALQTTFEGVRKRLHRSPNQRFYTPTAQHELASLAHMNSPLPQRESNYAQINSKTDIKIDSNVINSAVLIRELARDLRDSIENQQTISEDIADLFFFRLFSNFLGTHTRVRLTYLRNGQSVERDVILIGPMISQNTTLQGPKFEFIPIQAGAANKGIIVVEPSMVLNVQLLN